MFFKILIFTWFFTNHTKSMVFQKHQRQRAFFFQNLMSNWGVYFNYCGRSFDQAPTLGRVAPSLRVDGLMGGMGLDGISKVSFNFLYTLWVYRSCICILIYIYSQKMSPTFLWVSKFDVKLGSGERFSKLPFSHDFFKIMPKVRCFKNTYDNGSFFQNLMSSWGVGVWFFFDKLYIFMYVGKKNDDIQTPIFFYNSLNQIFNFDFDPCPLNYLIDWLNSS